MSRVLLIHWNGNEGEQRAGRLRNAGHEVALLAPNGSVGLRPLRENPPDACIVDLSRLPSQGCAVAIELRRQRGTRLVPIVFAGGDPTKIERTRTLLPDAVYAEWDRIDEALADAVAYAPARPFVPDTMAGYSGTPLAKKLGIRSGFSVALLGAPEGFERTLATLPDGVKLRHDARGTADLIVLFVDSHAGLVRRFPAARRILNDKGSVWIAWPKKASGVATDLSESVVRSFGLRKGLVDYKVCAIDEKWSGLLFTRRRASRASHS